jgi:hypothetical protein
MHDMIEGGHSMEMKKLIVHLNKLFKKSREDNGVRHRDTIAWGRAFQEAVANMKHGGKVELPYHLYFKVSDGLKNHIRMLPENGGGEQEEMEG